MELIELALNPLDWSGVSAITSILMLLINVFLLLSIIFAYRTIKEEVKNRDSSLLLWAMDEMSKIKSDLALLRDAGVYAIGELGNEGYEAAWPKETIEAAYRVSIVMQRLSYMAMSGLISKEHFSKMWGPAFVRAWASLEPYIHHKRSLNGEPLTLAEGAYSRNDFEKYALYCKELSRWPFQSRRRLLHFGFASIPRNSKRAQMSEMSRKGVAERRSGSFFRCRNMHWL